MAGNQAAFVQQYKMELQDLTFNSKAIINNLTMLASENKEAGAGIAEAITQHIKLVSLTVVPVPWCLFFNIAFYMHLWEMYNTTDDADTYKGILTVMSDDIVFSKAM